MAKEDTVDNFFSSITFQEGIFSIFKIGILIILALYAVFAFVILNQVRVMNSIVTLSFISVVLLIIAGLHLLLAISLFAIALVIL